MTTAQVFLGGSLFVLLIVNICGLPIEKGSNPSGSSGNTNTAANVVSNQKGASTDASPVFVSPYAQYGVVPAKTGFYQYPVQNVPAVYASPGVFHHSPAGGYPVAVKPATGSDLSTSASSTVHSPPVTHGVAPVQQSGIPQYAVQASSSSSGLDSSTQAGGAVQPEQAINWAVEPPKLGEETSNTQGLASSTTDEQSQVLAPVPAYHPGELSHFEKAAEAGDYQSETEELGRRTVPSTVGSGLVYPGFATRPFVMGGLWGRPYPYFDYMFMTGQYPPGTVSHFSQNYEQGRDYAHSTRYLKDQAFLYPGVNQQAAAIQAAHGNWHPSWHTHPHVAGSHGQGVTQTRYQVNPTD